MLLMIIGVGNAWGQALALPFNETFAGCNSTGGNDDSWSGTIASGSLTDSETDNDGWTFGGKYNGASACAKFGASKNQGSTTHYAQTPLLAKASSVTLTFKAGSWDGDETSITVATTSGTITPATGGANPFTASDASFTTYSFTITGITADFKITISSYGNKERFFLDDVNVVSAAPAVTYSVTWKSDGVTVHTDAAVPSGTTVSTPSDPSVPLGVRCRLLSCLYMGDFNAKDDHKFEQLQKILGVYYNLIGLQQVPHHFSDSNHRPELYKGPLFAFGNISSLTDKSFSRTTVGDILNKGCDPIVITRNRYDIVRFSYCMTLY